MKRIAMAGAVLALAVPAAANAQDAPTPRENAAQACQELRSSLGKSDFRQTYGKSKNRRNANGRCVSAWTKSAQQARSNAAHACKAEREDPNFAASHDGKSFEDFYGTNRTKKNAYGKCVAAKAGDEVDAEVEATENAAKACKAERSDESFADSHDGKSFADFYGTNRSKRNAFGKCVSAKAKAQQDTEE